MLQSVELVNFRCFRGVTVRLGPLTAIVGPNASGKTALLRAIAAHAIDPQRDVWHRTPSLEAKVSWNGDVHAQYEMRFRGGATLANKPIPDAQYLHLDANKMRAAIAVAEETRLAFDGSKLTNVIATLPRRVQEQLARDLARLVPVVQDFTTRPAQERGHHRLVFQDRWNPDVWYEPTEVSEGTILALGLLTLQYQTNRVSLVAIEEPEHGLHPYLLGEMVEVLRKLASGEGGRRPLQIVLATQSAGLLEFLKPEEVRFLSRRVEDGAVTVEEAPLDTESWRDAYEAHQRSLGSVWLSGGLGGVPTG